MNRSSVGQRRRIHLLRAVCLCLLAAALFISPYHGGTSFGSVLHGVGIALIVACVLGRSWATLHIGARKNNVLVQTGPYSLCRHPLYLFSTMAALGFGLMLQSLLYAAVLTSAVYFIFSYMMKKEEAFLSEKFGEAYDQYRMTTSGFIPAKIGHFNPAAGSRVEIRAVARNLWDCAAFLLLIPVAELVDLFRDMNTGGALVLF